MNLKLLQGDKMSNKKEWGLHIFKDAPKGAEFAAIDSNNTAYFYVTSPRRAVSSWVEREGALYRIDGLFDASEWENSMLCRSDYEAQRKAEQPKDETDEALRDRLKTQLAEVEARIEEKNRIKPGTPVWGWDDNKIMKLFGFYVEKNLSSHVIRRNDDPSSRVDLFEFENVERVDISKF